MKVTKWENICNSYHKELISQYKELQNTAKKKTEKLYM